MKAPLLHGAGAPEPGLPVDAEEWVPDELPVEAELLVPDVLRLSMARLLKRAAPNLRVLSHSEIPENRTIRVAQVVGAKA